MSRRSILIPAFLFLMHLVLGLSLYRDFGMGWDEPYERNNALVTARYLKEKLGRDGSALIDIRLEEYVDRFHGTFYTMAAYAVEHFWHLTDYRDIYRTRHLVSFLFFWVGAVAFFFVARLRLGDWRWGLIAWFLLLCSPRIFGDSFFNPKDIPLMSLVILSMGTLLLFLEKPSLWFAVLHAMACGMAISQRIVAVIVPVITVGVILLDLINNRFERNLLRRWTLKFAIFAPLVIGFTTAFWPYLWEQPLHRLELAFLHMSKFPWLSKVLLRGQLIFGNDLPWYYAPYWIFVSTPLLYTFLFLTGLVFLGRHIGDSLSSEGKIYTTAGRRADLALLALFLAPVLSVIIFHSVIYDGWRHLYFTYPSFLLLAVGGLQSWWRRLGRSADEQGCRCGRRALLAAVGISLALTLHFMIKYHPHQNVYFNPLTLGDKLTRLDLDYWGLSYKQGFEALARLDTRDTVRVAVMNDPGKFNYSFLPDSLQRRFVLVEKPEEANYYISVYRHWEDGIQAYLQRSFPYNGEEVYTIYAEESKILGIYRINP